MRVKFVAATVLALTAFLGGCAAKEPQTPASAAFAVEIVANGPHHVTDGRVYRSGDALVVAGIVRRPHEVQLPGHVVVEVLGPDGELASVTREAVPGLHTNKKGYLDFPFVVRLDSPPPAGSTVRLSYHGPHLGNCEG